MSKCAYCEQEYPADALGWKCLYCRKCVVANLRQADRELAQVKKELEKLKSPNK